MRSLVLLTLLAACSQDDAASPDAASPDAASPDAAVATSVVYVVRHAETGSTATDPSLDATGQARAQQLATLLADKGVTLVLSSQYLRTKETAMPVATAAGVIVTQRTVSSANAATYGTELATLVRDAKPHAALVVGHSNTVPATVKAFTGMTIAPIAESEYDRLYTITLTADSATAVESRY